MDVEEVRNLIELHLRFTGSTVAETLLDRWDQTQREMIKVMPIDYKRVLAERMSHDEEEDAPLHEHKQQEVQRG